MLSLKPSIFTCFQVFFLPYLHLYWGRAKKSVIEEADHQRILSTFARRAIAARSNGGLHVNLPKSESNVTFLSDRNPLTTHNPVYDDNSPLSSPELYTGGGGTSENPYSFSRSHSEGAGFVWTMPARIHGKLYGYEGPRRQALIDQDDWERQIIQAVRKERQRPESCNMLHLSGSTETKLSVREQARHFEQQVFQERALKQSIDSEGSLSPILVRDRDGTEILEVTSDTLLSIMDYPYSPKSVGRNVPPNIIITEGEDSWTLASQRPTPPVLRKLSASISGLMNVQPCHITVEVIPDPPENPAPPPPQQARPPSPSSSSISDPPSFPPSPPSLRKPQLSSQSSPPLINKLVCPPPPPPPPLPPPSPTVDVTRPVVHFVPTASQLASTLRPVSERKRLSPPVPSPADTGKKELKGILKSIQNLADIERSVANMYSQVDKNCKVPKFNKKPQVTEESEVANKEQSSDLYDEQSMPKPTDSSSAVQINSTSINCSENGTSQQNTTAEDDQTSQLNSPDNAELDENPSSQSTVF